MNDKLIAALYQKDYKKIKRLVSEGANINEVDKDGRHVLMHAVLADGADPEMVKFLIDLGADVNLNDKGQKWTTLHFASRDQLDEIVRILVNAGAVVDSVDCFGNTPLGRCLDNSHPNLLIIEMLLNHGADPYKKNNYENSPIDTAKLMGNLEILHILEKGKDKSHIE